MIIQEKVIDTHLHIEAWENEEYPSFTKCFEGHVNNAGLHTVNVCAVGSAQTLITNNVMMILHKLANPGTYAHGGVNHFVLPTTDAPEGLDLVTQYRELMQIGFDGIKMLEGKPNYHKGIGGDMNAPALDRLYREMEQDGTHLVIHVNDPVDFWNPDKASPEAIERGWFYGDGTYATSEELYRQAEIMLERHPGIKATFAHFFFSAEKPERVAKMLERYPNVAVDLTPCPELYPIFEKKREYYREFFPRYSDRVMLGTDGTFPWPTHTHVWCIETLYSYIATENTRMAFCDTPLTGIGMTGEAKENILWRNFERRVGEKPRPIDLEALRAYLLKYRPYIDEVSWQKLAPLCQSYINIT
ncbi:MAG: amidohydrolase family protein [Clostridia bacterium]|nr:amidohydrolase family protein [Clostridia bacterium]